MLFLGFISGKRIIFPGKWAKTFKNPGSLTSTQYSLELLNVPVCIVLDSQHVAKLLRLPLRHLQNRGELDNAKTFYSNIGDTANFFLDIFLEVQDKKYS